MSSSSRVSSLTKLRNKSVESTESVEVEVKDGKAEEKIKVEGTLPNGDKFEAEEKVKVTSAAAAQAAAPVQKTYTLYPAVERKWTGVEFIVYLVVTIIALVIIWVVGGVNDSTAYWNSLTRPSWGSNLAWQGVVLTIAVLLLGLASFLLTSSIDPVSGGALRTFLYVMYGLQLVFLIIAVAVLFRQKSLSSTFYLMIVVVIITFFQGCAAVYTLMRTAKYKLGWLTLLLWALFVAWLVYDTVFSYRLWQDN